MVTGDETLNVSKSLVTSEKNKQKYNVHLINFTFCPQMANKTKKYFT